MRRGHYSFRISITSSHIRSDTERSSVMPGFVPGIHVPSLNGQRRGRRGRTRPGGSIYLLFDRVNHALIAPKASVAPEAAGSKGCRPATDQAAGLPGAKLSGALEDGSRWRLISATAREIVSRN